MAHMSQMLTAVPCELWEFTNWTNQFIEKNELESLLLSKTHMNTYKSAKKDIKRKISRE